MTIIEKIKRSVEAATGLPFLYHAAGEINELIARAESLPVAFAFLLDSGTIDDVNGRYRERVTLAVMFADKSQFDFNAIENEQIIDRMKIKAYKWLQSLRLSNDLNIVSINQTQRLYDATTDILTGFSVNVTIEDYAGYGECELPDVVFEIKANGEYDVVGIDKVLVNVLPQLEELTITQNGEYLPSEGVAGFSKVTASVPRQTYYTGHIDEQGLRAIGWIDRDIEWFESVKDWNEEDDELYKVPQELIDAYVAAGNTWSEQLTSDNSKKWWLRYRPRGGESGFFADLSNTFFMLTMPNYEIWPYRECRHFRYSAKYLVINNAEKLSQAELWDSSPEIVQYNRESSYVNDVFGWFRDNSLIREIRGIINVEQITSFNTTFSLNRASFLRVLWIKNLHFNIRIVSGCFAKECLLYMINNEAATEPINIQLTQLYSVYSVDEDVIAALNNHQNVTISA